MPLAHITIEGRLLRRLDALVRCGTFPSRSGAIERAVEEKLERLDRRSLARECTKLDRGEERALAEEDVSSGFEAWPEY
ncbi:MAG: CopG family transcriptional regulator [Gemmatimonadales bacterium]|nr:CopG family transcriptional regulator [Gemmatimonadales bacterium]